MTKNFLIGVANKKDVMFSYEEGDTLRKVLNNFELAYVNMKSNVIHTLYISDVLKETLQNMGVVKQRVSRCFIADFCDIRYHNDPWNCGHAMSYVELSKEATQPMAVVLTLIAAYISRVETRFAVTFNLPISLKAQLETMDVPFVEVDDRIFSTVKARFS